MPVAHFYVTDCSADLQRRLLVEGSARYAEVLTAPIERVRVFVHNLPATQVAVGGRPVAESGEAAPYFTALMMRGRPAEVRARLSTVFTDLLVEVLGADRDRLRGLITEIEPENWSIAGVPASVMRADEIARRAQGSA